MSPESWAWPLSLASSGEATDVGHLLLAFAPSAVGLAALVAIGRLALRPLLKSVARAKSSELFMAACLLVVIGAGLISAVSGLSMPQFWLGLLLMYLFALQLNWLPSFGYGDGSFRNLILPAVTLGVTPLALLARTTRAGVLDVLNADFIRTAHSKGMSEMKVVRWHVAGNALVLIVTTVGLQFGSLIGQAVVIEKLFAWPGIGSLLVDSVAFRDIPVVQGTILVIVLWFLVINTAVDLIYAAIDPRINQE